MKAGLTRGGESSRNSEFCIGRRACNSVFQLCANNAPILCVTNVDHAVGSTMHTTILTFDAFNEIDSLLAFHMLNRVKRPNWRVTICAPTTSVTSMNGLTITAQSTLEEASAAD